MKSELKNVRDVMNKSIISVDKDDAIRMAVKKMVTKFYLYGFVILKNHD